MVVIGRHLGAVAAAAKDDAQGIFTMLDGRSQRMDHVGIVDALVAVGTEIYDLVTGFLQFSNQKLLHFEAAMVARYGYDVFHFFAVDNLIRKITYFHYSPPLYCPISERLIRFEKINGFDSIN